MLQILSTARPGMRKPKDFLRLSTQLRMKPTSCRLGA